MEVEAKLMFGCPVIRAKSCSKAKKLCEVKSTCKALARKTPLSGTELTAGSPSSTSSLSGTALAAGSPSSTPSLRNRHDQTRFTSPAPKPGGFGLRLRAKRRIGYRLNEEYGLNEETVTGFSARVNNQCGRDATQTCSVTAGTTTIRLLGKLISLPARRSISSPGMRQFEQ